MRSRAALLLSIVLGAIAVVMILTWARGRESELLQLSQMKDVVVATQDILANTIIDEQLVIRKQVPSTYVQPRALSDVSEVRGRVTAVPVPSGAQILSTYLEDAGRVALAYDVPRGRRAITIAVSDVTGIAGLMRPGNFVDVLGTFQFGRPTGFQGGQMVFADEKTETRLMLQNLQVAAVEKEHSRERPAPHRFTTAEEAQERAALDEEEANAARERSVSTVTLLATPEEAQQLVLAQEIGTLTLMLRSNLDAGQVVDIGSLDTLGLLKVPIPVKPRPRPSWREYRGTLSPF
jgi:pilus assembly protein CpaB